jgi:hypothetical protein
VAIFGLIEYASPVIPLGASLFSPRIKPAQIKGCDWPGLGQVYWKIILSEREEFTVNHNPAFLTVWFFLLFLVTF